MILNKVPGIVKLFDLDDEWFRKLSNIIKKCHFSDDRRFEFFPPKIL